MSDKSAKQAYNMSSTHPPPLQEYIPPQTNAEPLNVTNAQPPEAHAKTDNVNSPVVRNPEFPTTRSGCTVKPVNKLNLEIQHVNRK